jgi:hypothetical protein
MVHTFDPPTLASLISPTYQWKLNKPILSLILHPAPYSRSAYYGTMAAKHSSLFTAYNVGIARVEIR